MTDLREKIARALAEWWQDGPNAEPWVYDMHTESADAVLAVLDLDKVRAGAQVEALREVAQDAEWSEDAVPGMTAKDVIRGVRARADRIAREAGIATEGDER